MRKGFKLVPMHDSILPQYALMDPDLLAGLPFHIAAATAMDAFYARPGIVYQYECE